MWTYISNPENANLTEMVAKVKYRSKGGIVPLPKYHAMKAYK